MKTNELNMKELEQVNGGNFFADLEDVLRNIFHVPAKPAVPCDLATPETLIGRGKC